MVDLKETRKVDGKVVQKEGETVALKAVLKGKCQAEMREFYQVQKMVALKEKLLVDQLAVLKVDSKGRKVELLTAVKLVDLMVELMAGFGLEDIQIIQKTKRIEKIGF